MFYLFAATYIISGILAWRLIEYITLTKKGTLTRSDRRYSIFTGCCGWFGLAVTVVVWAIVTAPPLFKPGHEVIKRKD